MQLLVIFIHFIRDYFPLLVILFLSWEVISKADWFMSLGEHKKSAAASQDKQHINR